MTEDRYERITREISSESSPVGIDALRTHALILAALERLEERMDALDRRLAALDSESPAES